MVSGLEPRAKGTMMLPMLKTIKSHRGQVAPLLAPHLVKYLDLQILPTQWYPADDQQELFHTLVRALGQPDCERLGMVLASEQLTSFYRAFLIAGDGERSLRAMAQMWRMNYDTGVMSVVTTPGMGRLELEGFPYVSVSNCQILSGYFRRTLELAGMRQIDVSHGPCTAHGDKTCVWEAEYTIPKSSLAPSQPPPARNGR
ncbi:MAG: hypothetical protein KC766_06320 [Myxococcales bacterium]|nr:hypothetical protein [Myxococcales bacterium]